ncbi:MAG: host attachment protein [Deltaproteobacteria bacterium]|nr:host attachment protein [Deltaproteobacteria bacterium]
MASPTRLSLGVVVADGARARFFTLDSNGMPRRGSARMLREHLDLLNPAHTHTLGHEPARGAAGRRAAAGGPGRNDDASDASWRREQDRRFAAQIAHQLEQHCREFACHDVVLVADARMLGLLRPRVDQIGGLHIAEHTRDLTHLSGADLHVHLADAGLLPAPANPAPAARYAH